MRGPLWKAEKIEDYLKPVSCTCSGTKPSSFNYRFLATKNYYRYKPLRNFAAIGNLSSESRLTICATQSWIQCLNIPVDTFLWKPSHTTDHRPQTTDTDHRREATKSGKWVSRMESYYGFGITVLVKHRSVSQHRTARLSEL